MEKVIDINILKLNEKELKNIIRNIINDVNIYNDFCVSVNPKYYPNGYIINILINIDKYRLSKIFMIYVDEFGVVEKIDKLIPYNLGKLIELGENKPYPITIDGHVLERKENKLYIDGKITNIINLYNGMMSDFYRPFGGFCENESENENYYINDEICKNCKRNSEDYKFDKPNPESIHFQDLHYFENMDREKQKMYREELKMYRDRDSEKESEEQDYELNYKIKEYISVIEDKHDFKIPDDEYQNDGILYTPEYNKNDLYACILTRMTVGLNICHSYIDFKNNILYQWDSQNYDTPNGLVIRNHNKKIEILLNINKYKKFTIYESNKSTIEDDYSYFWRDIYSDIDFNNLFKWIKFQPETNCRKYIKNTYDEIITSCINCDLTLIQRSNNLKLYEKLIEENVIDMINDICYKDDLNYLIYLISCEYAYFGDINKGRELLIKHMNC